MKIILMTLWCVGSGLLLMVLGVLCLASPDFFVKLDRALTREVTRLEKIAMPYRIILGIGLIWIGIFLATLPRFLRSL